MPTSNRGRCHENIDVAANNAAIERHCSEKSQWGPGLVRAPFLFEVPFVGGLLVIGGLVIGGAAWGGGFAGRSQGLSDVLPLVIWGLAGLGRVLPLVIWGWLVWAAFCRRRFGTGWFGRCSGALGADSFAYGLVCRRAGAVGAGYAGEADVALASACATRTAVGCAGKAGMCWRFGL